MSSSMVGVPIQGTVLIDLGGDDPEFISVCDQVGQIVVHGSISYTP